MPPAGKGCGWNATRPMKVNEIFYSLQGEGYNTGTPAVFIRLSGCNLRCPFCDTSHTEGTEMTEADIAHAAATYPAKLVVVTGGEPSLQLTESLVALLHKAGKRVAVETNGTRPLPPGVDWVTLSPKEDFVPGTAASVRLTRCDELKVVYTGDEPRVPAGVEAARLFLQPCDTGDAERNAALTRGAVAYCLAHPEWRLSLQTHKVCGFK